MRASLSVMRSAAASLARWPSPLSARARTVVKWVFVGLLAIGALWVLFLAWQAMSTAVRQILVLLMALAAVLAWFLQGLPRLERRQALLRLRGDLRPGDPKDDAIPRMRMLDSLTSTKAVLQRSPQIDRRHDPLYAIPWVLFIGDRQAAVAQLLGAACNHSPFAPPRPAADSDYWRWWLYKKVIAIECDARLVCEQDDKATRSIWYHALQHLNSERRCMPLNGIAVTVSAQMLSGSPDDLRVEALKLRRLVDECLEHLQLSAPVYVIVTGLETLPGYEAFVSELPEESRRQVLGARFDPAKRVDGTTWQELPAVFGSLVERLHELRLAGIRRKADPDARRGVWDFVQAFQDMRSGLDVLIKALVEDDTYHRTPQWLGLYFVSTAQRGAFVEDLFCRFLPEDQPIAQRTRQPGLKRWIGSLVSLAVVALGTAIVLTQANAALSTNRALQSAVKSACSTLRAGDHRLPALQDCATDLSRIESLDRAAGLTWGIGQHRSALSAAKQAVLDDVRAIVSDYDARIESDVAGKAVSFDHLVAVAQRAALVERCAEQDGCVREEGDPNLAFDPLSPLFIAVRSNRKGAGARAKQDADALFNLYVAYLRWGQRSNPAWIADEKRRVHHYLQRIAGLYAARVDDIVAWARLRFEPVAADGIWNPHRTTAVDKLPAVDAAFTFPVWQHVVRPTVEQLRGVDDAKPLAQDLAGMYLTAYLGAWREFLPAFDKAGGALGVQASSELSARVANGDSPYQALRTAQEKHVFALPLRASLSARWDIAWSAMRADWTGSVGYVGSFVRDAWAQRGDALEAPAWVLALRFTLSGSGRRAQEALRALAVTVESDKSGAQALQLAKEIFASQGEKPEAVGQIRSALDAPPAQFAAGMAGPDLAAWRSVSGELRMMVASIAARAMQRIDEDWRTRADADPAKEGGQAAVKAEQVLQRFAQGALGPFIDPADGSLKEVLGAKLPVSARVRDFFASGNANAAVDDTRVVRIGALELAQASTFGMVKEGPEGTTIEVTCGTQKYVVSSKGSARVDRSVSLVGVPDQCSDARITIALPPVQMDTWDGNAPARPRPAHKSLVKVYGGDVLTALREDFKSGAKTFDLIDFRSSYSDAEWAELMGSLQMMGINQARVFAALTLTPEMHARIGTQASPALPRSLIEDAGDQRTVQAVIDRLELIDGKALGR